MVSRSPLAEYLSQLSDLHRQIVRTLLWLRQEQTGEPLPVSAAQLCDQILAINRLAETLDSVLFRPRQKDGASLAKRSACLRDRPVTPLPAQLPICDATTQTEPHWNLDHPQNPETPAERGSRISGARIRTGDLADPNGARYQAAPRPDADRSIPHRARNSGQTVSAPPIQARAATLAPCPANCKTPSPNWTNSSSRAASRTTAPTASSSPAEARSESSPPASPRALSCSSGPSPSKPTCS